MSPYRIAIMNEDIAKFVYDSMQQRTKRKTKIMKSTSLRAFSPEISESRHASFRSNQNSMYLHLILTSSLRYVFRTS